MLMLTFTKVTWYLSPLNFPYISKDLELGGTLGTTYYILLILQMTI